MNEEQYKALMKFLMSMEEMISEIHSAVIPRKDENEEE